MQFTYGFGPLMVIALTGSASLAGLSVGLVGLSRFFVSYPVGKITDALGRKPGILMGLGAGARSARSSSAVDDASKASALFVVGMLIFGMGMNASQQLRVAATDMFPPQHRAQALGYLAMGSLLGLAVSPLVISISRNSRYAHRQRSAWPAWFLLPLIILPGMIVVGFVRPDPKEIGQNLHHYYPDHVAAAAARRAAPARAFRAHAPAAPPARSASRSSPIAPRKATCRS